MIRDLLDEPLVWVMAGLLVFVIGACIFAIKADREWGQHCEDVGGHRLSRSSLGTGFGANGQMVTTTSTVEFCVSADGRILF